MKIWIDFINTPQVSFWIPFIKEFEKRNYELILTCRDSGNTIGLLDMYGLNYTIIGEKVGKGKVQKMLFFPKRLFELYSYIKKRKPDVAASQSSFYQPVVARLLGIPSLYTNDNEHAKGNIFGFWFANKVVLPSAFINSDIAKKWPLKSKLNFYPSVKEAIYLSQQEDLISAVKKPKNVIYFRPEPWSAQYYSGPLNFFDKNLLKLASEYKIVVLPRDKNQIEYYKQQKFNQLEVAEKPLSLKLILGDCKLFIGAGGSMTRELAVMGISVVSIYQDKLLKVDKYLAEKGYLDIDPKLSYDKIKLLLVNQTSSEKDLNELEKGRDSYKIIRDIILNLN